MKVLVASNEHAPDGVRARGTPTNVPAFAAAFGCKPGDPMVNTGEKLLTIW
jgi:putative endopeptidase